MKSAVFLQSCFTSACANTLLLRDSHPLNIHKATAVVARRTTRSTPAAAALTASSSSSSFSFPRRRHRRICPTSLATPYRRRRTSCAAYYPDFLRKTVHSFTIPKFKPLQKRVDASRHIEKGKDTMEQMASMHQSLGEVRSQASPAPNRYSDYPRCRNGSDPRFTTPEASARPRASLSDDFNYTETRSERSGSTASRVSNRLSLTLPIAPPTAYPSRPTPASSTTASFPPTPLDTPALISPVDSNDFITAIAAQERRVLELREELSRAESDLSRLKKQFASHEAHKKRRNIEPLRTVGPFSETSDDTTPRGISELERRKALLLGQQSQPNTPERSRRRVFQGGHTRTLSLLSPTKPTGPFSVHEDNPDSLGPRTEEPNSLYTDRYAPITPSQLAKRASWAPRSTPQTPGVKQIAQDFKAGLWTFMEDLRQATVGDEPITGQGMYMRGSDGNMRPTMQTGGSRGGEDHDTIRAPGANSRARVSSSFYETPASRDPDSHQSEQDAGTETATQSQARTKTESQKAAKRFSWTPLPIDSIDDNDWSNWDSPSASSPTRWSGTTVNGDIIPSIPEKQIDENDTPLNKKSSKSQLPGSPTSRLEELLPPVLNRLTPSNFKRTASDFMKEWEKSLSPPPAPARELVSMSGRDRSD
ncbi:hypothetical protein V8F33_006177 [Rhypophila sp. PSN 637]